MVFVDIDDTLWDFGTPLYVKLYTKGYNVLPPRLWKWYFAKGIVLIDEFYKITREVQE